MKICLKNDLCPLSVSPGILGNVLDCYRARGHCLACLFIGNTVTCTGDLWKNTPLLLSLPKMPTLVGCKT